jgi:basic amino acid/polyamine antiporter, APA family
VGRKRGRTLSQSSVLGSHRFSLGLLSATMLVVGNTIGVGIFTTSGVMAEQLPSPGLMLVVWAFGGLLSLAGALAWAELAAAFPLAGGEYIYLREAFGPFWGFLSGWAAFLASFSGSIAVLAIALAEYLAGAFPFSPTGGTLATLSLGSFTYPVSWNQLLAIFLVWGFSFLNYRGLHLGSWTQNLLSLGKLAAIVGLLVAGFCCGHGSWAHFSPVFAWSGTGRIVSAAGLALIPVMFTYSGWNAAAYIASEVRNPETTLPQSLALGTLITIVAYLALNILYLYALPVTALSGVVRVGEQTTSALFGSRTAQAISALIAVSIASAFNVMVLTGGRIYFAMACDRVFFSRAAEIHPRFHTPGNALLMQAAWTSLLILSGTFEQLLTYATIVIVSISAITVSAVFVLRWRWPDLPRPYHVWGYPWMPVLYVVGSAGIFGNALWERPVECLLGAGLCAAGVPAYWWWRRVDSAGNTA